MQSASVKPRQRLLVQQFQANHGAITSLLSCNLQIHPGILEQRRLLSQHSPNYASDRSLRPEGQPRPLFDRAVFTLHYKPLRTMRPRSNWSRLRVSGPQGRADKPDGWSPWGWNKPTWAKPLSAEQARFEQEFEEFKRRIHADPYGMLFGRRLQRLRPFQLGPKDDTFSSFARFLFGVESRTPSTKMDPNRCDKDNGASIKNAKSNPSKATISTSNLDKDALFQFDPISGRMVPRDDNSTHRSLDDSTTNQVAGNSLLRSRTKTAKSEDKSFGKDVFASPQNKNHDLLGQRRSDGVWLMGSPKPKQASSPTSSPGSFIGAGDTSIPPGCNNDPVLFKSNKPDTLTPRTHHSLFSTFKDYLSAKLETVAHKQPPRKETRLSDCRKELPTMRDSIFKDPERRNIDSLRAVDVRASFKQRKSDLGMRNWESKHVFGFQPIAISEIVKASDTDESHVVPPARDTQNQDRALIDENRDIHESTYDEIGPSQRSAMRDVKMNNLTSITHIEDTRNNDAKTYERFEVLLSGLEKTLDKIQHTNAVAWEHVEELGKLGRIERRDGLHNTPSRLVNNKRNAPENFKVLAYDPSTMTVRETGVSSMSSYPVAPSHPVEVISRINHPSKFLELFPTLEAQGYEVFSGSGDMLIFKETRREFNSAPENRTDTSPVSARESVHSPRKTAELEEESIEEFEEKGSDSPSQTSPTADGRQEASTRSDYDYVHSPREAAQLEEESIKEFETREPRIAHQPRPKSSSIQHDTADSSPKQSVYSPNQAARREKKSIENFENSTLKSNGLHPQTDPTIVQQQETHFTGIPPNWPPYDPDAERRLASSPDLSSLPPPRASEPAREGESRAGKTLRRVFLAGTAMGGTCYAIGVVAEYFRTGGQDGQGPRGFTGLEGR